MSVPRRTAAVATMALVIGAGVGALIAVTSGTDGPQDASETPQRTPTPTTSTPATSPPRPGGVDGGYVSPRIGVVAGSDCSVFPADNVWHAVVDGPEVPVAAPDDPRAVMLAAASGPARAAFGPDKGEGLNVVPTETSQVSAYTVAPNWLASSNLNNARSSDVDRVILGPASTPQMFADLESPPADELQWANMSLDPNTDNRLYLLDTDECIASEFIGFSGLALRSGSGLIANRMSRFDLTNNNRRASRVWGEGPCPVIPPNPWFQPGCDGTLVKPSSARGGSGLSGVGGLVRAEEVGSETGIDHAISMVLPANLIADSDPVWPATVTDGLGSGATFPDAPEGAAPIPMGSRMRLRGDFELGCSAADCPQATEVIRALKRYGVIVVDSMGATQELSVAAMHLHGEISADWDPQDLRQVEMGGGAAAGVKLSDFELIDAEDMRALPQAGPQDDGWLQVR